jgi:adenine-specific DNA-methyltransferase
MKKMKMHSKDFTKENVGKIRNLFPQCVVEVPGENGKMEWAIDFDQLRQELSASIVEGPQERYQLNWPGKREALLTANAPIAKTLRPCREESVDFDTTQNLFIEGDNLDALKLLQETYLNKVKMIYIDPPYNTGNDFIYEDDFAEDSASYFERSNQRDPNGHRLTANTEGNGRFHSDWLTMMYSRLKLARNLLRPDGVILISIDNNEASNLRSIMDEIFGSSCYKNTIIARRGIKNVQAQFDDVSSLSLGHEYMLVYARNPDVRFKKLILSHGLTQPGKWDTFWRGTDRPTMRYELFGFTPDTGQWRWEAGRAREAVKNYQTYVETHSASMSIDEWYVDTLTATNVSLNFVRKNADGSIQYYVPPNDGKLLSDNWMDILLSGNETTFDTEKSTEIMERAIGWICSSSESCIVLDFFSGSATTAHAVMSLNAQDGGKRKFVLVQLPALCDTESAAFKAGHKTISSIGKDRIRRAGKKVKQENTGKPGVDHLDIGFRVLKIDGSNMKEVFYTPDAVSQDLLSDQINNIREDRTSEDLLFQVLLDWGVDLALPITQETIADKTVYFVDGNALTACFETGVSEEFVKLLAKREPLRAVFRDAGFASDSVKINVEQIFKLMSPGTEVKTI